MVEELIAQGEYFEALSLLDDRNDEHVRYLRLVCLIGMQEYKQAKNEGMIAKALAEESYYDVVSMYITALKELGEYDEAINILVEELSMPYIPYEYDLLLNEAYDQILIDKMDSNYDEFNRSVLSIEEIEQVLKNKDASTDLIYMAIDQLQQLNIRMILPTIKDFLLDHTRDSVAKSLIMEILIEQEVDEEFEVEKYRHYYDFNAIYASPVLSLNAYDEISRYLSSALEDDNPSLLEQCLDYLEYYLYAHYPKEIYDDEYNIIAATIHYYVATLSFIEIDFDVFEMCYQVSSDEIQDELLALKDLE